jgi:hypothetical protein
LAYLDRQQEMVILDLEALDVRIEDAIRAWKSREKMGTAKKPNSAVAVDVLC